MNKSDKKEDLSSKLEEKTKEIAEELWSMVQTYNLEWVCFNQMKVMQSLWE